MGAKPADGFIGVLMLDTRFPRPPGDVGNAETFRRHGVDVRYQVVANATPRRIVGDPDPAMLQAFIDAAVMLAARGARLITTSCGFLAAFQKELAQAVPVPVVSSSLLACAPLAFPGIVTIDAGALGRRVLAAAGVAPGTPVQGVVPGCEFHRRILGNEDRLDLAAASRDVVSAALALVERSPTVHDIVLECTNMPPYRDALAAATGRTVHDIETVLIARWRQSLEAPPR